jgi:DNA-binding transcriptional LysR family regulator
MDWNDVRHFLALARFGSVRAAGASLGVSHSTVARRVEALEERLATRLFDRSRDGYTLTEAGEAMLPGAERVEQEMAALERGLVGRDGRLAGPISITCSDHYVADLLIEALLPFQEEHPAIELTWTVEARLFDLSKREADIAVRALGRDASPPEHYLGQRVVPLTVSSYVATAHAHKFRPDEGVGAWIGANDNKTMQAILANCPYPDLPVRDGFGSLELLVRAARHGLGYVMLPTYVGDTLPWLQRLPIPDVRQLGQLWLLSHPDLRDNARFRATRAAMAAALRARMPLFDGSAVANPHPTVPNADR